MKYRKLRDLEVSAIGMGCMGFSHGYGALPTEDDTIKMIQYAFDKGCTFFDTAENYGPFLNEELVGKAVKPFRDKIILATKFSPFTQPTQTAKEKLSREGIREAVEGSLKRLQTDYIDLYYEHRVPLDSNVEEVAEIMGELIKEGKIRGWGQSQSTEEQIRKAHAVTPLTAIQSEYSMMERMFEKDVIPTCKELNIGFVPFSPLASGFLSGKYDKDTQYKGDDVRLAITRFIPENVVKNQPLLDMLKDIASAKNSTPAQISLAWMLYKYDFLAPIPGMRKYERIDENLGAAEVELTEDEFKNIEAELEKITIYGNRTDEDIQRMGYVKAQSLTFTNNTKREGNICSSPAFIILTKEMVIIIIIKIQIWWGLRGLIWR